ncbi:uncharacterized protein ARMOST_20901 [Armillaria ostoyae]|uniref:Peptidase C14 caspase domain-containing protein n=1 Tax=Armillaria ostoyae TaxID=47428 RepID=A0A284S8L6_ARMOS|nr:uncharacterized protein ARMOST_20901 [Armillaria ostoyae]
MAEQRPHVLYAKELIYKGCGIPFWYPEPDSSAPDEFKTRGICPGDVGIINNDGGFDFLFSIFSDANGLIIGRAPPGFQPLPQLAQEDVQVYPVHGNVVTSQHVTSTDVSVDASTQTLQSIVDAGMSFNVSISDTSAAILCLPNYSTRYNAMNKDLFERCARQHGVSWYNYVIGSLGRKVSNGSLYLITTCDKTTTWGNAVIRRTDRALAFSLKCTLMSTGGVTVKVANSWIDDSGIDNGLFPIPSVQYPYPIGLQNQCIFARGFVMSLSESLFKKSREAVLLHVDGSKDRVPTLDHKNAPLPPNDGNTGLWTRASSFFGSKTAPKDEDSNQGMILAQSADHELLAAEVSEFPTAESEQWNPSAIMNEYLLSKVSSLDMAITHDEEWMAVMQQYECVTDITDEELWCKIGNQLDAIISRLPTPDSIPPHTSQETHSEDHFTEAQPSDTAPSSPNYSLLPPNRVDGSRFWALLIGIDAYPFRPLRDCMSDARKIAKYLIQDLGVPEDHIKHLLSTGSVDDFTERYPGVYYKGMFIENDPSIPTRANIIDALLDLSTNSQIQYGDNIIIYFSGHGSLYKCSDFYEAGSLAAVGHFEALCPMDRTPCNPSHISIPDISDREMRTILDEISHTKGHHITCILDCCYSENVDKDPGTRVRITEPLLPTSIKDMLDATHTRLKDLGSYRNIYDGNWVCGLESYVILAGYEGKEVESTNGCGGVFTQALIEALKSDMLKGGSTYSDLITTMQMPSSTNQLPMATGTNLETKLWYQA